ncbi:MAG: type 4a pilus biogenesis protein PilO [Fimbriimonadales bacterium]|nr:type 4a pilus biogenesis protein PilO [Fimbriimonadales bacterium]
MAVSKRIQRAQRVSRLLGIAIGETLLLGLGSLYLPWSMTQSAQERLQQKQNEFQQAQQAAGQLRQTTEQLQKTQQELQFLERGVSEAAYVPTMLKQFEQTALQRNLQIVSIRPQVQNNAQPQQSEAQKTVQKAYQEQLFEIQLRGKFWDLMSLLKSLESFPKILAVQSLNAQAKSGTEQSAENPHLEIRMIVKAFIFRSAQARPSANTTQTGG